MTARTRAHVIQARSLLCLYRRRGVDGNEWADILLTASLRRNVSDERAIDLLFEIARELRADVNRRKN